MYVKKTSRRDLIKGTGLVVAGTALAGCLPAGQAVPGGDGAAPADVPEVHLWPAITPVRPEGSHADRYEAVQNHIIEQTGIKAVGFVAPPGAAGQEKRNLMLGSRNERLDLFVERWPNFKDIIIPLNDLIDQYGQDIVAAHDPRNMIGMEDLEGNIWGIPRLGLLGGVFFTWFRTDWMEELGLEFSKEQMTWEYMEEVIGAFKERDPEAVVVTNSLDSMRKCLAGGWTEAGYNRWFDETDGTLKPPELQPGFVDWVARMNEWWNKGWFQRETFGQMDFEEVLRSGKMGVHSGWYSRLTLLATRIIQEGVVPGMKFDFPYKLYGSQGLSAITDARMDQAYMITKKCPNPEAVMQYINWQYDPGKENAVTAHFGIKGVDWEWVDANDKYYVRRLAQVSEGDHIYAGELYAAAGLAVETWYATDDVLWRSHQEHIRDLMSVYDNSKLPIDFDVPYDVSAINDKVPGMEDIGRLQVEETTKFITGVRPLSEWDDFIQQLYRAGLNDWIEAYTEQYLLKHPA